MLLTLCCICGCKKELITVIDEPTGLTIESLFAINGNGFVTLGWTPVVSTTPYELVIHRGTTEDFFPSSDTYVATLPSTASRFVDTAVVTGRFYYYRLVAVELLSSGQKRNGKPSNVALGRPYDYSTVATIHYSNHIQTIFTSSCAVHGCHVGYDNGGEFSLKSWSDLFEGSKDGAAVIPYKVSKSDLIFHTNFETLLAPVAQPHMPLTGFDIPRAQIQTLIRWIDQGAPNDQGAVAYTITPKGKVFVVNASEDLIAVIDVEKNLVIRYVNVGKAFDSTFAFGAPHHVKVDRQGRYFYVTLITSQQLWKFSAATYEFLGKVSIPQQPADIVLSATGDTAYVTSFTSNPGRVTMVDTRTMQVIGTILMLNIARLPHGALLSHDGSKLFITNSGSGNIAVIRTVDNSQFYITLDTSGRSLTSDTSPYLCDITPDDRYVFVTDYKDIARNVYVIDLQTDSTKPSRAIPIGGRSVHVAITPDGRYAFVCNSGDSSVNVINTLDFSVTTIVNVGRQPHGVIFTPDGLTAYVTTENLNNPTPPHHPTSGAKGTSYVVVIDVATKSIVKRIEVGAFGQGISLAP